MPAPDLEKEAVKAMEMQKRTQRDEVEAKAEAYANHEVALIEDGKARAMWRGPLYLAYLAGWRAALKRVEEERGKE